ncbi:MAG: translation elongation factor 4 [bacterium]
MKIRNFSIIAHIDHGKSTLADRLLEKTHTISRRMMQDQVMDKMDLERERGITIKAKAARLRYTPKSAESEYVLNLIDTPGHVDFSYEVSRALAACEGVILLVDASQGVEAQTLAHAHLAQSMGLKIIPVINKVDLSSADPDAAEEQIWEILKSDANAVRVSAKNGTGVAEVLERIVSDIPGPGGNASNPLAALIFDSFFDPYRGVILYVRLFDGYIREGMNIHLFSSGFTSKVEEVGYLSPDMVKAAGLSAGEVGYLVAGIRDIHQVKVGDTIMEKERPLDGALPGCREATPVVFAGVFPINPADYPALRAAIEKLNLSDSSFHYQPETSRALGFGFRLGFMGLLHMDVVKERLEREFNLSLLVTTPNAVYRVKSKSSSRETDEVYAEVDNPADFPDYGNIVDVQELYVKASIITPVTHMEAVMNLLKDKRGEHRKLEYISNSRVIIEYNLPLSEIIVDFYDKLKSVSKGYASFDYEPEGYHSSDVVRIEILLHGEPVDALSFMTHKNKSQVQGRLICEKLKELIPRQMFEIAVQARVEGRIVARETVPAIRKDVLAKCYGGDITRKKKLLSKQKEGKKRLKQVGNVEIPQEAFMAMLKITK